MHRCLLAFSALALVGLGACDGIPSEESETGTLYERLARRTQFASFAEALSATGLVAELDGRQPITVFAPTATAFLYVGDRFLAELQSSSQTGPYARVIRHHVVAGRLGPDDFVDGDTLRSLDGLPLPVRRLGPVVQVGGVTVDLDRPIEAGESVAYPVADVILGALTIRERITLSPSLSAFEGQAQRFGLLDAIDAADQPVVFAPSNDAVSDLGPLGDRLLQDESVRDVAEYVFRSHVTPRAPALAGGATLVTLDGAAVAYRDDGRYPTVSGHPVLHEEALADGRLLVLDGVVLETLSLAQRLRIEPGAQRYVQEFQARQPELWARLADDEDVLTVFAPTDLAYGSRSPEISGLLAAPAHATLSARIVRHTVFESWIDPADLKGGGSTATPLDGAPVRLDPGSGGGILIEGVSTQPGDRVASNGRLFLIDQFALPPVDGLDTALLRGFTEHVSAVLRAGLEAEFRRSGVTAFVAPNEVYLGPDRERILSNPGTFLRWNATGETMLTLRPGPFTALDGSARALELTSCPTTETPESPVDGACSPWRLDDRQFVFEGQVQGTHVYEGLPSLDGQSALHVLRTPSYPPGD